MQKRVPGHVVARNVTQDCDSNLSKLEKYVEGLKCQRHSYTDGHHHGCIRGSHILPIESRCDIQRQSDRRIKFYNVHLHAVWFTRTHAHNRRSVVVWAWEKLFCLHHLALLHFHNDRGVSNIDVNCVLLRNDCVLDGGTESAVFSLPVLSVGAVAGDQRGVQLVSGHRIILQVFQSGNCDLCDCVGVLAALGWLHRENQLDTGVYSMDKVRVKLLLWFRRHEHQRVFGERGCSGRLRWPDIDWLEFV